MNKYIFLIFLVMVTLLYGCASNIKYLSDTTAHVDSHEWFKSENNDIRYTAELIKIGYSDNPKNAINIFKEKGLDVTFFSPGQTFRNYPEVFILSTPKTNRIIVLFVGTDSIGDWFENIKGFNYEDIQNENQPYIMPGHGGFRRGILNLINNDFFTKVIIDHVNQFDVRNSDRKIGVIVTGHSQGAGLAQLSLTVFDGYINKKNKSIVQSESQFKVIKEIRFASPYAISTWKTGAKVTGCDESLDSTPYFNQWELIRNKYEDLSINIIREDDMVPAIWFPACGDKTTSSHYGEFIRIDRGGKAKRIKTEWKNVRPHHIDTYIEGLKNDF